MFLLPTERVANHVKIIKLLSKGFVKIAQILGTFLTKKQEQFVKAAKQMNLAVMVNVMSVHKGKSLITNERVANCVRIMK